ncbi:MAG TPA: hypothetical protein VH415_05930 [Nitrososphaeraceae archaeon]
MLAIIIVTSTITLSKSGVSFALIDRTIGHSEGSDKKGITGIGTTMSANTYIPVSFGSSKGSSGGSGSESSHSSSGKDNNNAPHGGPANNANGPCKAGFPKVDVRARHIKGLSLFPVWHTFVIYADCSGTEYFYRGGPGGPGGTIIGTSGQYKSGTVDWDPHAPSVTVAKGNPALGKDNCFQSELSRIDRTHTPYKNTGPNSNTVAKTLIANCGFTPKKPVTIAPGWGDSKL